MRRDPLVLIGAGLLVAAAAPYVMPGLPAGALATYSEFYVDVPLIVWVIVLAQVAARTAPSSAGRRFWHLVSGAMGCWLLVRAINIAWLLKLPIGSVASSDVTEDVIYVGFYLLFAIALEMQPHRSSVGPVPAAVRTTKAAGALVIVFALFAYFVIVPLAVNPPAYQTWVPSLLLYVTFDTYLVVRLAALGRSGPATPWDRVYGWMLATAGLWLVTDSLEAMTLAGSVLQVRSGSPLELLWLCPLGTMILAARAVAHQRPPVGSPGAGPGSVRRDPLAGLWGGPVVLYASALPLLHFALYGFGVLDPVSRVPREGLTFVTVAVLAPLAWLYQGTVESENRRLAAELQALAAQLRPHFLLNALNAVAGLLGRDPVAAETGLVRVGQLLRYTLDQPGTTRIPLAEEWRFTSAYLDVERLRLGDRLSVRADLGEEAGDCLVPRFVLQPLVENAVRHAVGPQPGGARIELKAWVTAGTLCLAVQDDGPGADPAAVARSPGVGLRAVRAQLLAHYGERASLQITTNPGAGFQVAMRLPAEVE